MTLAWPWVLALLPLPWLYRRLMRPAGGSAPVLRARHYARLTGGLTTGTAPTTSGVRLVLLSVVWLGLLLAAARPTWVGEPITLTTTGRDLMLAVDISDSMRISDMRIGDELLPRITVLKAVAGDFIHQRQGDRLGLILFGSQAYLQAPLTFDLRTVQTLLTEAQVRFAGLSTAIGDAIVIAIKRLEDQAASSKVLILLSDGADTASTVPPLKAAELAARQGIVIHTIGLGATPFVRGGRVVDPAGDLDEATLRQIAEMTGGHYFRAHDPTELAGVYAELNAIEPVEQDGETLRPRRELFHWPLGIALAAWVLLLSHQLWRGRHD